MEQILIIEDDIALNKGLCKALKTDDRQILSCSDLTSARSQLLCGSVSLILLDINLPDGNGLDFLREIKQTNRLLPVILLTANDTDLDIVEGLEQGADDYITKPFSLAVLRARVHTQLRKAQQNNSPTSIKFVKNNWSHTKTIAQDHTFPGSPFVYSRNSHRSAFWLCHRRCPDTDCDETNNPWDCKCFA